MNASTDPHYSLDRLAELAGGVPPRTLRFWIAQGLVPRPDGGSRRAAHYGARHLDAVLEVLRWQRAGLSLERIRELRAGTPPGVPARPRGAGTVEVWTHLVVADGIELMVEPGRAGLAPEQLRALAAGIGALHERVRAGVDAPDAPAAADDGSG